jgi:hypothetical protein
VFFHIWQIFTSVGQGPPSRPILRVKREGARPPERQRHTQQDIRATWSEDAHCLQLAQDSGQWQVLLNTVRNLLAPSEARHISTSRGTEERLFRRASYNTVTQVFVYVCRPDFLTIIRHSCIIQSQRRACNVIKQGETSFLASAAQVMTLMQLILPVQVHHGVGSQRSCGPQFVKQWFCAWSSLSHTRIGIHFKTEVCRNISQVIRLYHVPVDPRAFVPPQQLLLKIYTLPLAAAVSINTPPLLPLHVRFIAGARDMRFWAWLVSFSSPPCYPVFLFSLESFSHLDDRVAFQRRGAWRLCSSDKHWSAVTSLRPGQLMATALYLMREWF